MTDEPSTEAESGATVDVKSAESQPETEIVLELPDGLRAELKDPLGPIFEEPAALLSVAGESVIAVGDMVTYHLVEAGRPPDVAFVDERTERSAIDNGVRKTVVGNGEAWFDRRFEVANPSATLTVSLLEALLAALDGGPPTIVTVYGEEDLATLPAIVAAPDGASVVYGQPGAGMVHVEVDTTVKDHCRSLLERMNGDPPRALSMLAD